jgi:hypothetical protein
MVLDEPYEDAVRLRHLEEQDAARLEAGRAAFLDLEISVLRALANALRDRDAVSLWPLCLNVLNEALSADEATFYFRMDRWFYGYDIASGEGEGKGYLSVYPGGLSNLLMIIGYCEKELTIGTMDRTKRLMPPAVLDDASFRSYFQAIGQPWQPELDRPLDHFVELGSQEAAFGDAFQHRVSQAIPGEFTVTISRDVKQKFAASIERLMSAIEEELSQTSTQFIDTSPVLQPMLQRSASVNAAPDAGNVFRKDDDIWTIRYAGTTVQLPAGLSGLDYLAYLLQRPGRECEVQELDAAIRGNLGPAPSPAGALSVSDADGIRVGGIGDAGDLTDEKTIKAARARVPELKNDLKNAIASGDTDATAEIRRDLREIQRYLRETIGLHGRPRTAADPKEKARINVQRRIALAIERIAKKHAALGAHLTSSVRTGNYCVYDPPTSERITWTC